MPPARRDEDDVARPRDRLVDAHGRRARVDRYIERLLVERALGEPVDAPTCERLGLVNAVAAPDAVISTADELATRLAAGPTVMLSLTKRLLAVSSESSRDRAFEQEAWAAELISHTSDLREGLRAFAERRTPEFQGR